MRVKVKEARVRSDLGIVNLYHSLRRRTLVIVRRLNEFKFSKYLKFW